MILIDFSALCIEESTGFSAREKRAIDILVLRRIVLAKILRLQKKFKEPENSNVVLCLDGNRYWRRSVFPYYKQGRAKARRDSDFNWNSYFEAFNVLREELLHHRIYPVVTVPEAEADDIIGVIALRMAREKPILIISTDKDFIQLQLFDKNIKQYSPRQRKYITLGSKNYSLKEHIIRGDAGDGIPNIFSDADTFVNPKKRQTPIRQDKIDVWDIYEPEGFCRNEADMRRLKENTMLIDFRRIPKDIAEKIFEVFSNPPPRRGTVFSYMVKHKLLDLEGR